MNLRGLNGGQNMMGGWNYMVWHMKFIMVGPHDTDLNNQRTMGGGEGRSNKCLSLD